MRKNFSMKAIPLAAAMTATLMFGAAAHAQTGAAPTTMPTDSGATTKAVAAPKNTDVNPAPVGGTPKSAEARTAAQADKKAAKAAKRAARKDKMPAVDATNAVTHNQ